MVKLIPLATAVGLLTTGPSFAQSYCDQVRAAVAIYGYEAARQHAMAHYGPDAVRYGDACLTATDRGFAPGARDYQGYWASGR